LGIKVAVTCIFSYHLILPILCYEIIVVMLTKLILSCCSKCGQSIADFLEEEAKARKHWIVVISWWRTYTLCSWASDRSTIYVLCHVA